MGGMVAAVGYTDGAFDGGVVVGANVVPGVGATVGCG